MRDENKSFMGPTQGFSYSHMTLFFIYLQILLTN